jgi:hypothetical protein
MKPTKQIVYSQVKVEDELPENGSWVICDGPEELLYSHNYGFMYNSSDIVPKDKQPTFWLKPQEVYFFTPEQLNEYTQSVIKQTLEVASEKPLVHQQCNNYHSGKTVWEDKQGEVYVTVQNENSYDEHHCMSVDKDSITNTFEETYKKFEV